jgi:TonB family protein
MVFCQACGARNADDARFCNMCGARIAAAGEPGGPLASVGRTQDRAPAETAPALPTSGPHASLPGMSGAGTSSTMSGVRVSLEAIGVRSSGKTWAILIGGGLVVFAAGAGGMYVAMRIGAEPQAEVPPERPVEAPTGPLATPDSGDTESDDVEFLTARPRGRSSPPPSVGGSAAAADRERAGARSGAGGASAASVGRSGTGSSRTGTSGATVGGGRAVGESSTASGGGGSGATVGGGREESATASGGGGSGATVGGGRAVGESSTASGSGGRDSQPDWAAMEAAEPGFDPMQSYGRHVRRVIREFYVRRAQSCFDHESRLDREPVRGTVVIGFTIEESGEVTNSHVVENTTGRESLAACLARQVDQWRLPPPPEEVGEVEMAMPFRN